MPQTFYIEADEEIISVIGRLRKSASEENIFVFPKRALVLQSIINLRLFQREAQKLGKKIVIVSQDEVGKMLAEKIGVPTQNYSEDFFRKDFHLEFALDEKVLQPTVNPREIHNEMPRSDAIGSLDFHVPAADPAFVAEKTSSPVSSSQKPATTLRVRNVTPPQLTSLNSKRFETAPQAASSIETTASLPKTPAYAERGERLKNFYSGTRSAPAKPVSQKETDHKPVSISGKKARRIFFVLGAVSLISLAGVALFLFLPKAEIYVTPYKITQNVDIELAGNAGTSESDVKTLAVRILEKDKEIVLTVPTTGKSGGVNQKAHGTVIIYNNQSAESQPLVATTRLETADGKIFRLVSGVTVPGMTNKDGRKEAGVIEAEVTADQTGEEYNIDATTFRIPGFKGGPKYETFSAKSIKAMTGGGSAGPADVAVVAKVDIDTAEREAKEKIKEEFLNDARNQLGSDEKILEDQIDIVAVAPATVPQTGTPATAFDYKNNFKVRAFVFSEKAVREKVDNANEKNFRGIRFRPVSSNITYSESVANFSEGKLRLVAHALVTMESDIDKDALREAMLGKNKNDMQNALSSFPEVKKIEVVFYPEWFVESVPSSQNRVTVIIKSGENEE